MPETPLTLRGRTALVTGGASGIGAAVATHLAELGARVVVLDRDAEGAAKLAAAIDGESCHLDLTDGPAIDALEVEADILVNNAGYQHIAPIEEFDVRQFRQMHQLMLEAPFLLARRLLPGMYGRGWGRMVHVSSVHGHRASPYKAAYVSAKHGLEGLSKVIALEGAAKGVTSNTVCPSYVRTPLVEGQIVEQARAHGIDEDQVLDQVLLARSAVRRLVEPEEVAEMVGFLCGAGAASVTGSSFRLDGGWTAA
jgi:3-hydroxybutyrate dehydrogenase